MPNVVVVVAVVGRLVNPISFGFGGEGALAGLLLLLLLPLCVKRLSNMLPVL